MRLSYNVHTIEANLMDMTWQSSNAVRFLAAAIVLVFAGSGFAQQISAEKERELIAILRSDAPKAEKAVACKGLAIDGSSEAVPALAELLADQQLASWARIALEVIPGAAADEALRNATDSLEGRLLVGTINSIGVRRDAGAVELLSGRLADQDPEVASAAAVALGHIGTADAAAALRPALAGAPDGVRSAVAEGCVLCAERILAAGNAADAAKIYDEVRTANVPRQRIQEATRGAILARGNEGIPLLVEQLRSSDQGLFQIALSTAREFPGGEVDQALAAELDSAPPERAALVVLAMADRPQTVPLPAILKAASGGEKPVRLAAIEALGRVGDATCLAPLLEIAVEADAEIASLAKGTLARLPGQPVDQEIAARLERAEGKVYLLLIELVGMRRIDAVAPLLKALNNPDKTVRSAALASLGSTAGEKHLSVLIEQVVAPHYSDNSDVAQQALKAAAIRMPDREACAAELAAALDRAPASTKVALLEIVAAVGGTKALATVGAAANSRDPALQDAGSRLLGEWMTIDAAPVLLELAKSRNRYQTRALRGYIRIARQFNMTEPQRAQMCASAMEAARQPAEQKLVLEVLTRYPSLETLKLAVAAAQKPELKDDASKAALAIAQKLGMTGEVQDLLSKAGLKQ